MKGKITLMIVFISLMAAVPIFANAGTIIADITSKEETVQTSLVLDTTEGEYTLENNIEFTDTSINSTVKLSSKQLLYSLVGAVVSDDFSENEVKALTVVYHTQICTGSAGNSLTINTSDTSQYLSENNLKEKFGSKLTTLRSYIDNVYNEIIIRDNVPLDMNIPNLNNIDNTNDSPLVADPYSTLSSDYITEITFDEKSFIEKIRELNGNIDTDIPPQQLIGESTYTINGNVDTVIIGGEAVDGSSIVQAFGLPHNRFTLLYSLGEFRFDVMKNETTQYLTPAAAHQMAEQGNTYQEIIALYYQ